MKKVREKSGFYVGQEGEFEILDTLARPIETVQGRITELIEGEESLYALIRTEKGLRPGRIQV